MNAMEVVLCMKCGTRTDGQGMHELEDQQVCDACWEAAPRRVWVVRGAGSIKKTAYVLARTAEDAEDQESNGEAIHDESEGLEDWCGEDPEVVNPQDDRLPEAVRETMGKLAGTWPTETCYQVKWECDMEAINPHAAATKARSYVQDFKSIAHVYDVRAPDGQVTRVDLDGHEPDRVLARPPDAHTDDDVATIRAALADWGAARGALEDAAQVLHLLPEDFEQAAAVEAKAMQALERLATAAQPPLLVLDAETGSVHMAAHEAASAPTRVVIRVRGGMVLGGEAPPGTVIVIEDYDIGTCAECENTLPHDTDGRLFECIEHEANAAGRW